MADFNFKKRVVSRPTVIVENKIYGELRDIAKENDSTIPEVTEWILKAGLEEYKKWQAKS